MSRPTKRRTNFRGLPINVEIEPGDVKGGKDALGRPWETVYTIPYGEIDGTAGADGDPVDVYLGEDFRGDCPVFVVHQVQQDLGHAGALYDEDKVFLGFAGMTEALDAYYAHGPSWGVGGVSVMTFEEFRDEYLPRGSMRGRDPLMFGGRL